MKAQTKEHAARQALDVVAVAGLVAVAQAAVFLEQALMLLGVCHLHLQLELGELVAHGGHVCHRGHDLVDDRPAHHLDGLLLQVAHAHALREHDLTAVCRVLPRDDVHHRGLASAVGAHQGHAVALVDAEGGVREEGADAVGFGEFVYVKNHKEGLYPRAAPQA